MRSRTYTKQRHKYLDTYALVRFVDTDGTWMRLPDGSSAELIYGRADQSLECTHHKRVRTRASSRITSPSLIELTSLISRLSTQNATSCKTLNPIPIQRLSPPLIYLDCQTCTDPAENYTERRERLIHYHYDWCPVCLIQVLIQSCRHCWNLLSTPLTFIPTG